MKSLANSRILFEMIDTVKQNCIYSSDYLILVLDDYTLKLISQYVSMYELMQQGVYHVERLCKKRKWYPRSDAIYFISPDSLQLFINDFKPPEP